MTRPQPLRSLLSSSSAAAASASVSVPHVLFKESDLVADADRQWKCGVKEQVEQQIKAATGDSAALPRANAAAEVSSVINSYYADIARALFNAGVC